MRDGCYRISVRNQSVGSGTGQFIVSKRPDLAVIGTPLADKSGKRTIIVGHGTPTRPCRIIPFNSVHLQAVVINDTPSDTIVPRAPRDLTLSIVASVDGLHDLPR